MFLRRTPAGAPDVGALLHAPDGGSAGSDEGPLERAAAALRESEDRYRSLFSNMTEGFALGEAICDAQGVPYDFRFLEMNEAFERQTGLRRDDTRGRPIREVLPRFEQAWIDTYCGIALGAPARRFDRFNPDLDRHFSIYCYSPRRGQFAILFTDITLQKRNEETLRHLVEQSPFGIYIVDAEFRLVQVSAGAQKVFENVRPLLGRDFADVLRAIWTEPFATEAIDLFRHTLATGEPYHAPSTVETRHDTQRVESYDWKIERILLPDGRYGVVCHFYDLSERQRYEAALRGKTEQLESLLLAQQRAEQALQEADRRKDEFLAMLSHELRNPLASIRTGIHLLDRVDPAGDAAHRARDAIRRQTEHLTRLVDDLLDVTRISRGKIELKRERVNLTDVLRRAIDDLRAASEQAGVVIELRATQAPAWIQGDVTRLAQIVGNLLQNALKFTPAGGQVVAELDAVHEYVELVVRDTGIGMTPGQVEQMFEPFTQGDTSLARTKGGLGLGLSLVRALAGLHGGSVVAASDGPGTGSAFTVRLPAAPANDPAAGPTPAPRSGAGRVVVLIEDNVDAALVVAEMLRAYGHRVHVAHDAQSGLDVALDVRPDVLLCDLGLPDLDGFEVARRLRTDDRARHVLLVALTGYAQPDDLRHAHEAGFDRHLAKPPDPDALLAAVEASPEPDHSKGRRAPS